MTGDLSTTQDDLAFVKALVNEGPKAQGAAGQLFLVAGVLYGLQCLIFWAQLAFDLPMPPLAGLLVGSVPTVLFLIILGVVIWRDRRASQAGVATRALNAAWGSAGLVNMVMVVVFGFNAGREKSMLIWLFYPIVVCAIQGGVWYVAYMIRRKAWLGAVSAGWLVAALALGFMLHDTTLYVLTIGLALLLLMALPGYVMMKQAQNQSRDPA